MPNMDNLVFESPFYDDSGERITCSLSDCSIGNYVSVEYESPSAKVTRSVGGCASCDFSGDIIDIFNPESSRYIADAPDCFLGVAANVLTQTSNGLHMLDGLRSVAPTTARLIEGYLPDTEQF